MFLSLWLGNNSGYYPGVGNSQRHNEIFCQDKPSITVVSQQLADNFKLIFLQKIRK